VQEDITERKALQAQLIHREKLATIGQMAAGMAHEMRQPLNVISMTSESIEMLIEEGGIDLEKEKQKLELIRAQTVRMAEIIDHMRVFSRKDDATKSELFDPGESVGKALRLVEEEMRLADIRVAADLDERCRHIFGHSLRLEQVMVNLLANAKDAILGQAPVAEGAARDIRGEILVELVDDTTLDQVRITVSDTGGGIPEDVIDKIFEPFFTTKEVGEGTGLGLSLINGIVTEMGGQIEVANGAEGARFEIALPVDRRRTERE